MNIHIPLQSIIPELWLIAAILLVLISSLVFKGKSFTVGLISIFALLFVFGFTMKNGGRYADMLNFIGRSVPAPIVASNTHSEPAREIKRPVQTQAVPSISPSVPTKPETQTESNSSPEDILSSVQTEEVISTAQEESAITNDNENDRLRGRGAHRFKK